MLNRFSAGHTMPLDQLGNNFKIQAANFYSPSELTHIKCYRSWEVDEESADTLTHNRGYPNREHEFVSQTRGPGPHLR
ncbi:MAG TPA: hypothetical protein VK327_15190, partial [Candidatus Paceibacterota bacterium]|nr:hypothetical protein [Candidatus Paceibacterota bacterium]